MRRSSLSLLLGSANGLPGEAHLATLLSPFQWGLLKHFASGRLLILRLNFSLFF